MAGDDPEVEHFVDTCTDYDRGIAQEARAVKQRRLEIIRKRVAELRELHRQADVKLGELVRSAAIEVIWPEAFACGRLERVVWAERLGSIRFIIRRSDGVERRVQAKNMPEELRKILNCPRGRRSLLRPDGRV